MSRAAAPRPSCLAVLVLLAASIFGSLALAAEDAGRDFGAGISLSESVSVGELARAPERFADAPVLLRGRITDVCTRKGCWTVLAEGDETVRVTFLDYGFFLPKDCAGSEALVEGRVVVRELSAKQAAHYDAESRVKPGDPAPGPRRELGLVATGVRLLD